MNGTLLITGATGALGPALVREIVRTGQFERVVALVRPAGAAEKIAALRLALEPAAAGSSLVFVEGSLGSDGAWPDLPAPACILHAAADTRFRAPLAELSATNLEGTRQLLAWAGQLPHPPRFIHFSTTCAAGRRTGLVGEAPLTDDAGFVNDYERTKWQAEQLVLSSPLPTEIVRLATVVGRETDGRLHRPGAFHTTLRWFYRGLLPMVPGDAGTCIDLISTELVTGFITRLLARPARSRGIYHLSNGDRAPRLEAVIELAAEKFSARSPAWRTGQILPPVLAARPVFEDFRVSVLKSRDALFTQVLESVDSFLPELFYPKTFATAAAAAVWGGELPLPPWPDFLARVLDSALDTDFGRQKAPLSP